MMMAAAARLYFDYIVLPEACLWHNLSRPLMTDKPNNPLSQLAELQNLTQKALQPSVALMADWQKAFQPSAPLMAEWQKTLQSSAAVVEQWQKWFAVQTKELKKPPRE